MVRNRPNDKWQFLDQRLNMTSQPHRFRSDMSISWWELLRTFSNHQYDYLSQTNLKQDSSEELSEGSAYLRNENWTVSSFGSASKYTKLFHFSRGSDGNCPEIRLKNMTSLLESGFNTNKATKLLIHGWMDSAFVNFAVEMREAYLEAQDVNVIAVDWSWVAGLIYPLTKTAVTPIGIFLAQFVDWLVSEAGVSVGSVHIIGHSLGAHIAGVVGAHVTTGRISRITGLDPAGPGFDSSKKGRLDSSDAEFVDIIHTSGLWAGFFGACGHADFYPNNGVPNQPGCPLDFGKCSHIRSYKLFAESIYSQGFVSNACTNWKNFIRGRCANNVEAVMGEHVDHSARGSFYLRTAGQTPYALGNNTAFYNGSNS